MTGEISLRGRVLPVGGIKAKVLAASRAGIERIILPGRNRKDLVEVPPDVLEKLEMRFVDGVDEAIGAALEAAPPAPTRV
jgi:ATP-dependent Lon protease